MVESTKQWAISILFLFLFAIAPNGIFADVRVQAQIKETSVFENEPATLLITVIRDENMEVDVNSFQIDGKNITVEEVATGKQSSISIINGNRKESHQISTTYRYPLQGKPKGLQIIQPISVVVDGKSYQTTPITYSVEGVEASENFRLEGMAEFPAVVFPGSRGKLIYKIYFKENVELTRQDLPLMDASGFKRIGEINSENIIEGDYHVLVLTQEVEALRPGTYRFDSSLIQGRNYTPDIFGRRKYQKKLLHATAPPVTVEVMAFPAKDKPELFNGAIGDFDISARVLSSKEFIVGDKIEVEVKIAGEGSFETVSLPPLKQIPGIEKNFRYSDIPPAGKVEGLWIKFILELRPLNADVREIPPMPFSFFNSKTKAYETVVAPAIPITVVPLRTVIDPQGSQRPVENQVEVPINQGGVEPAIDSYLRPSKIPIRANYPLTRADVVADEAFSLRSLYYIPLFGALLGLQVMVKRVRKRRAEREIREAVNPDSIFERALAIQDDGNESRFFQILENAFIAKLRVTRNIGAEYETIRKVPKEDLPESVRVLFHDIETYRFASAESPDKKKGKDALVARAKKAFEELGGKK